MSRAALAVSLALAAGPALAADAVTAIVGARIVTVSGPVIEKGTIVIAGGKIAALGAGVPAPAGATVIDGTGRTVYPGLIDGLTTLGLTDTYLALILPYTAMGLPLATYLLKVFLDAIPEELFEAARIDGAGDFRIFRMIALPLLRPGLATVAVFTFFATYNDFFGPLIYLSDREKQTIAVALNYFTGSPDVGPQMHLLMAMAAMATIPSLVMFIVAQRFFVRSIMTTGIKG